MKQFASIERRQNKDVMHLVRVLIKRGDKGKGGNIYSGDVNKLQLEMEPL